MPSSPLPSAQHVSLGQRIPLTRTKVERGVSSGALLRYNFHSGSSADPLTLRLITTQTAGPGKRSSGRMARNTRKSATNGPLCPSSRRKRRQAEEGHCLARSSSGTLVGLAGCSRSRCGTGPLREGACGGTQLLGRACSVCPSVSRSVQTFVSLATSAIPLIAHNPAGLQPAVSHHFLNQLGRQFMLGLKGSLVGNPAVLPQGPVILSEPGFRQVQPSIQQGCSLPTGIAQEDARLAVIFLARVSAPLGSDSDRMSAVFGKVGAIHDQHTILFPQRLVHQVLVFCQQGVIIPGPFPDELLEGAHLPLRMRPYSQQTQGHRFHILAGDISREQSA